MLGWPKSIPDYRWPDRRYTAWWSVRRAVLALIFHAARMAGRIVGIIRPNSAAILVIRTDGIGDAVLFEPALRSLADRCAGQQLHLWAPAATCELFGQHPSVSQTLAVPRGGKAGNLEYFDSARWRAVMGWRLGRHAFAVAAYAVESPEPLGDWLLSSVRARQRWYCPGDTENQFGWQRERTSSLASRLLASRVQGGHELLRNAHLANQWGGVADSMPRIALGAQERWQAEEQARTWRKLASAVGARGIVGIMSGSAAAVNAYPAASWAQVIRMLWTQHRAMAAFFGGSNDQPRITEISRLIPDVPHGQLPPNFGLRAAAASLQMIDGLISVDTGLAHVATALNVPTVVLRHGGHPGRFFPWPTNTASPVLSHPMPCEGCRGRCVQPEAQCLTRIAPEEVVSAYAELACDPNRVAA